MFVLHLPYEDNALSQDTNTIVVGTTDSVESTLDMAQAYDVFGWNMISCLSSGLVEIEPGSDAGNDSIVPALAVNWTVLSGGMIWDFSLRQGVVFEDGAEFNATIVKYTFDRNCNLTGDGLFPPDGPQLNMGYDQIIDNVTVLGDYAVRFYLKIPYAPFLQLLSIPPSYIVDPKYAPMDEVVQYTQGNPRLSHPCGLGPYLLESWSRVGGSDSEIRLVANPNYWDASSDEPVTNEIKIEFYSTDTALAAAMAADEIEIAFRQLTMTQIQTFKNSLDVQVFEGLSPQIQYLCFNQDIYPFNETFVREAIAAALNRTELCNLVFLDQKEPLYSMIPSNLEYYEPTFNIYGESNYTFSQYSLALYGYNAGNKLPIDLYYETSGHYPQSQQQALLYATQLENTGVINVTLHGLDWPSFRLERNMGTMPVFIYGWYNDYPDADNYEFLPFASWLNLGYNETYPQGGVDQYNLWVAGRSAMSDTARRAAYHALQNLQAQECSVIPLWQGKQYAVANLQIDYIDLDITGLLRYWLIEELPITGPGTTTLPTTPSSSTTTTTNTTGSEMPTTLITLIISVSSVAVIIIVVIVIIRSRSGGS